LGARRRGLHTRSVNSSASLPAGSVWAYPGFVRFLIATVAVTFAIQLAGAVAAYQLYALTRDPLSLGALGLAEALPFISLALYGGHVADRHDRRRVVIVVLAGLTGMMAAFALGSGLGAQLGGLLVGLLYGLTVLGGVLRSFLQPARAALNAELLPPALYAQAVSVRSGLGQLGMAVGPALGGGLYALVGATGAYIAAAVLALVAFFAMLAVPSERITPKPVAPRGSLRESVAEGVRYLLADELLLPAQLLDLFAVLFGGATALLPVFAEEILRVGPTGYGVLRAAPAVGAVLASLALVRFPVERAVGRVLLVSVMGFGVVTVAFALSTSFALSLVCLALGGALDMVSVLIRSTLLQTRVPGHLLGRVASINQIFVGSSNEIGAFESGVAARLLGTVPSVVFGGTMTILVALITTARAPALRRLEKL
jgi:MFS family permease